MEYGFIRINNIHKWEKMEMRKQSVNVNKIFETLAIEFQYRVPNMKIR